MSPEAERPDQEAGALGRSYGGSASGVAGRDLLLEIGTEEIPAKFQARALGELPAQVAAKLGAARLAHGDVRALGTPRRIAVVVQGLAERQPDLRERVFGPPVGAAFGADGAPTKAAIGFAQKNGVDVAALEKAEQSGKKGLYVVADRFVRGRSTLELLPALLGEVIAGIAWPKSMRWSWGETAFVRPVQWLVALYGGDVVPMAFAGQTAGRRSRGHRFLAPGWIDLAGPADYVDALRRAFVIVDPAARRDVIRAELMRVESETGLRVRPDDALLDEVTHLAEYPVGVAGGFDPAYLEVPEEVIVTAMRTHQRYFAMADASGALAPRFATLAATVVRDPDVVRRGNEVVLAARLADAQFFFREDQKVPLASHASKLDHVVFQAKLGDRAKTIGDKVRRLDGFVRALAEGRGDVEAATRAARLCKADLATGVVGEFPELQGIMGMHYARRQGQGDTVADAIADHYLPRGQGSALPRTVEGALLAIADRMDTLVGCFATGLEPTGSADPYGLRRAALGVLAILFDRGPGGPRYASNSGWPIDLDQLIVVAVGQFKGSLEVSPTDIGELREFFRGRLRGMLIDEGLAVLDVDAALGAGFADPTDARLRARDLAVVPSPAREVFKRIANILDDAAAKGIAPGEVAEAKLVADAERKLWQAYGQVQSRIHDARTGQRYRDLFAVLVELQPTVAAFFDKGGVMVMDPDPALRANRLGLLSALLAPFAQVADFRLLAGREHGAAP